MMYTCILDNFNCCCLGQISHFSPSSLLITKVETEDLSRLYTVEGFQCIPRWPARSHSCDGGGIYITLQMVHVVCHQISVANIKLSVPTTYSKTAARGAI